MLIGKKASALIGKKIVSDFLENGARNLAFGV